MPLTTGEWHTCTITALSTWTNPIPSLPGYILDVIDQVTTIYVFCSDDSLDGGLSAMIHFLDAGGNPGSCKVQHAAVNVITTPTKDVSTWDNGDEWTSIRVGLAMLSYSTNDGGVRRLADSSALGAFAA